MPAAILGDRACGKTTFLGLLYAAQVKYGTRVLDSFRFHAPLQSLRLMSQVYEGMKDARFPGATLKDEMTHISFVFGYRKAVSGRLPMYMKERNWVHPFAKLNFAAYDVSGEDVQEFIDSGVAASPIIQQLLKSHVVVILVDCSKMTTEIDSPQFKHMLKYDSEVASLLVSLQTYKRQEFSRMRSQGLNVGDPIIYPAIVLSKFDSIRDDVLVKLGLHRGVPSGDQKRKRKEYAEALLRVFLPQTLSQLRGGKVAGVNFDQAAYFFSWVRTETSEAGMAPVGPPRIVRKEFSAEGGAEPDFSYDDYVAFIEHFRNVANKVPDEVVERENVQQSQPEPVPA
ncbi:MAG: hypothetical protein KGJ23_12860 [Euryarchaeota archaeon]|nr:hypothetical protein [Euryarchaeota archaeon]MDE1837490.1 hypothetical protein [Euryarchaeota archaeon]MDE1880554.1 hypothetical protein [Euryarchaeota archaeon]MDE2045544.1 hypothetical protein [Thermoplasmata archaeon]